MTRISPALFTYRLGFSILNFCITQTLGFVSLFEPILTQVSFFQLYTYQYHFWLEYLGPQKLTWSSISNPDRLATFFGSAKMNVPLNVSLGVSKATYLLGRSSLFERSRVPKTATGFPLDFPDCTEYETGSRTMSSVRAEAAFVRYDPVRMARRIETMNRVAVFGCLFTRMLLFMPPS